MPRRAKSHSERQAEKRRADPTQRRHSDQAYERKRAADPELAEAKRIRDSARWQRIRNIKLNRNPLCEMHAQRGLPPMPAREVDHIQGLLEAPHLAFDLDNLRSLCLSCHRRKTAAEHRERKGKSIN